MMLGNNFWFVTRAAAEHFSGFAWAFEIKPAQVIGRRLTARARGCRGEILLLAVSNGVFLLESAIAARRFDIPPRQCSFHMLPDFFLVDLSRLDD